jgi:hypothetical protein
MLDFALDCGNDALRGIATFLAALALGAHVFTIDGGPRRLLEVQEREITPSPRACTSWSTFRALASTPRALCQPHR